MLQPASPLDPLSLGLVLAALGMGGTLLTLYVLSLVVSLLKRLFPAEPAQGSAARGQGSGPGPGTGGGGTVGMSQESPIPAGSPSPEPPTPGR